MFGVFGLMLALYFKAPYLVALGFLLDAVTRFRYLKLAWKGIRGIWKK
jgi:hypothetical protein